MSKNLSVETDVKGTKKTIRALRNGFKEGLKDSGEHLLNFGKRHAKEVVWGYDRVWNKKVKRGFSTENDPFKSRTFLWKGTIHNSAPHAKIVDVGLAPKGEIVGSNPSVQDIIEWVDEEGPPAADYQGPSPGSSGGDKRPDKGITGDFSVGNYRPVKELGLDRNSFSSDKPRIASLGDGTTVIWKSRDATRDDENEAIRHEVVWSRAQEMRNWDVGPKSRSDTHEINGEEIDATIQEYVQDSTPLQQKVFLGRSEDPDKISRDRFLFRNREWASQTTSLDYLLGNYDRHRNNLLFDSKGNVRAIDNGGEKFESGLKERELLLILEQEDYNDARNRDKLHKENMEYLDNVENRLSEIAEDLEFRKDLIEEAREIHGENSKQVERLENVMGEQITEGHFMHEGTSGTPLYKRHIQNMREWFEKMYNSDPKEHDDEDLDDEDHMDGFGDIVDGLLGGEKFENN